MNEGCQEQQEQAETVFQGCPKMLKVGFTNFFRVFGKNISHRLFLRFILTYEAQYKL